MLLDIQVPLHLGETPDINGGRRLLEEVLASRTLKRPSYIIGLTEYADALVSAGSVFGENLFALIECRSGDDRWKRLLEKFVAHVISSAQLRDEPVAIAGYRTAMAVVCALNSPELEAVLALPYDWKDVTGGSCNPTFETTLKNGSGIHRVIATSALEMGMPAAAALCAKTIERFRPRYIAMTGIAGGMKGEATFGDIIAAEACWDYSGGKVSELEGVVISLNEPRTAELDPIVKMQFQRMIGDQKLLMDMHQAYKGKRPDSCPSVHQGLLFTGTQVITSKTRTKELVLQHRKLRGIDMEGYAVFAAAKYSELPRPTAIVVKAVSDFADPEKADEWRPYASHTSASFLFAWAIKHL